MFSIFFKSAHGVWGRCEFGTPFLVAAVFACASQVARADIICDKGTEGAGLTCKSTGTSGHTEVLFRRVPAWGFNAGIVLVDMCRVPGDLTKVGQDSPIKGDAQGQGNVIVKKIPIVDAQKQVDLNRKTCLRRYCTDEFHAFSFLLDGAPIPLPPAAALAISIGFSKSSFEVKCQNIDREEMGDEYF